MFQPELYYLLLRWRARFHMLYYNWFNIANIIQKTETKKSFTEKMQKSDIFSNITLIILIYVFFIMIFLLYTFISEKSCNPIECGVLFKFLYWTNSRITSISTIIIIKTHIYCIYYTYNKQSYTRY